MARFEYSRFPGYPLLRRNDTRPCFQFGQSQSLAAIIVVKDARTIDGSTPPVIAPVEWLVSDESPVQRISICPCRSLICVKSDVLVDQRRSVSINPDHCVVTLLTD